jgi:hypothetical protein
MGDPREGCQFPAVVVNAQKHPEAESSVDVWVLEHIDIVIEVDESMVSNLPEGCQGQ